MTIFTFGWFSILIERKYISSTSGILWTILHFWETVCWCWTGCLWCLWRYFQLSSCWWKPAECFCAAVPAGRNESCLAQRRMSGKWIGYLWPTFFAILNLQLGLMYQPGPGEPAPSCRIKILSLPSAYIVHININHSTLQSEILRRRSICNI